MQRKSLVVLPTGDTSEMPVGDWPTGVDTYLQSLPNYAAGRLLTSDMKWTDQSAPFSGKALIIVDFNSIGAGRGSSHEITSPDDYAPGPFAYTMMNSLYASFPSATFGKKNFSVSGRQTPTMISQSGQVDAMYDPSTYDRQIIVCGEITNHIADGGASATDAYNSYVTYCKARRAKGFTVVATTVINRTTNFGSGMSASEFASRQAAVNALLRANYLQFADALADIATLNLTLPDGTHPNDAGYVTMGNFIAGKVAPLVQIGFNSQSLALLQSGSTSTSPGVTPVLLLRGQGTNNSTSIIDEGTPVHVMTANGAAKISTTQFKFGSSSIYLDGSTGTHVSTPSSTDFDMGSGDFTMEAWLYKTSNGTGFPGLFVRGDNVQNQWALCWPNAGARLEFYVSSTNGSSSSYTAQGLNTTTDTPLNAWTHIALVRSSGATKLYQNGVLIGTATTNTALETQPNGKPLRIGFLPAVTLADGTGDRFVGYIHARMWRGAALYTAAFTPSTSFEVPASQPTATLPIGGSAGQVLQKKSTTDYDTRWTSFPHQLKNAYPVGNWIQPIEGAYVETGTTIGAASVIYFVPFYVQRGITISDLGARVTTAVASSLFQLCIYNCRPTDFLPGVKVASTGDLSGATVATISAPLTESTATLDPFTVYWFGVNTNTVGLAFMASSTLTSVYTSLIGSSSITNMLNSVPNSSMVVTANISYGTYPDLTSATVTATGANAKRHAIPLLKVASYPTN